MKYQVTAVKDNMGVRFFLTAPELREAINQGRAYVKAQTDQDDRPHTRIRAQAPGCFT